MSVLKLVSLSCALMFVVMVGGMAVKADDEVVGAIWKVERQDNKDIKWQFRAGPKGVVWTVPDKGKPEKLGTWSGNGGETILEIDAPDVGKIGLKRTITIVCVQKKPLKWQGEVKILAGPDKGKKFPLTVTLVKD